VSINFGYHIKIEERIAADTLWASHLASDGYPVFDSLLTLMGLDCLDVRESNMYASVWVLKPVTRNESNTDGELCLNRVKPEETLVEARSGSDVQIDRQIWQKLVKQFYEVKRMIRGLRVETALTYSQTLN
ncbi:6984_t:CDS:2, partial [Acaulospora morrowiae]